MKIVLMLAGIASLIIGTIGIFVPILPTTPFVLLAGFCFIKSSDSLYKWLINNKYLGKYIDNYVKYGAVTYRSKVISIIILWIFILTSVLFFVSNHFIDILLLVIAIAVSVHIALLKQMK